MSKRRRKHPHSRKSDTSRAPANSHGSSLSSPALGSSASLEPRATSSKKKPKKPVKDPKLAQGLGSNRDLASVLSYGPGYPMPYTQAWTDSRLEQVRAFKHWTFIAIRALANQIGTRRPNVSFVYTKKGLPGPNTPAHEDPKQLYWERQLLPKAVRNKALTPLLTHEELLPAGPDHPLTSLLRNPNDPDVSSDFIYETLLFLCLTGSAYWWMPKNKLSLPEALWVIPSHWMWPIMGTDRLIDSWEIRPVEGNYLRKRLPADEIIHFRFKNPISKIDGFSPQTAGAQWCDVQDSINRSQYFAYKNGTFPTVAVQFDGKLQEPSDEDLRRIGAKFIGRYTGEARSNTPLFLPPGVQVKPLAITPNQMVFGETADRTRDNILALFGVPKLIAGISENMTYGSVAAAQAGFCAFSVNPIIRWLGEVITEKLAVLYDPDLRVWWEDMTPGDPELLEKQLMTDLMAGALSSNELRLLRGREPWPNFGNDPIFPVNMTTLPMGGANKTPEKTPVVPQPHVAEENSLISTLRRNIFSLNGNSTS